MKNNRFITITVSTILTVALTATNFNRTVDNAKHTVFANSTAYEKTGLTDNERENLSRDNQESLTAALSGNGSVISGNDADIIGNGSDRSVRSGRSGRIPDIKISASERAERKAEEISATGRKGEKAVNSKEGGFNDQISGTEQNGKNGGAPEGRNKNGLSRRSGKAKAGQRQKNKANRDKSSKNSDKNKKPENLGVFRITAYCGCARCCGKSNGITASGTRAKEGRTIAADTSNLPFGTKVVIGKKTYVVEDRGGSIGGKRIDIYFNSHEKALQWGVRYMNVYVK